MLAACLSLGYTPFGKDRLTWSLGYFLLYLNRRDRVMEPRRPDLAVRLGFELLEDRVVPGLLTITPRAEVISSDSYIVSLPSAPNVGLTIAQGHTNGVVHWTRGT